MTQAVRVVVSGVGAITPTGSTAGESWDALLAGQSGVAPVRGFAAKGAQPGYAGEVKDLSPERIGLNRRKLKAMGRQAQLAFAASQEACADAALDPSALDRERIGIVLGVGMLNADVDELGRALYAMHKATGNGFEAAAFNHAALTEMLPLWLLRHIPNLAAAHASIAIEAQGPSNTIATGCVAGANAIGEAMRIVARGDADVMIAGGADARVSPLAMLRYRELGWLSVRNDCDPEVVSAPFDEQASGFVTAEGGGAVVIESAEHAERRGARILAELVAYTAANDATGMRFTRGDGSALQSALERCAARLAAAGSERIDSVFAPASGLPPIDKAVASALAAAAGDVGIGTVTATRSALGHAHAASAAIDTVLAVKALDGCRIPPVLNLQRPIEDLPFSINGNHKSPVESAIVGAYGFGGHAAAIGLRRWHA